VRQRLKLSRLEKSVLSVVTVVESLAINRKVYDVLISVSAIFVFCFYCCFCWIWQSSQCCLSVSRW